MKTRRIAPGTYTLSVASCEGRDDVFGIIEHEDGLWVAEIRNHTSELHPRSETLRFAGSFRTLKEAAEELGSL